MAGWACSTLLSTLDPLCQTVENLFYVSFLIRDGRAGILQDSNGLPTLRTFATSITPSPAAMARLTRLRQPDALNPRSAAQIRAEDVQKQQAILSLDYATWRALIDAYGITKSMIPDRQESENGCAVAARGWYA